MAAERHEVRTESSHRRAAAACLAFTFAVTGGFAQAPPPSPATASGGRPWLFRHESGSERVCWNSNQFEYERGGKRYRINDAKLLADFRRLYRPIDPTHARLTAMDARQAQLAGRIEALASEVVSRKRAYEQAAMLTGDMAVNREKLERYAPSPELAADALAQVDEALALTRRIQERRRNSLMKAGQDQAALEAEQAELGKRRSEIWQGLIEDYERAFVELRVRINRAIEDGRARLVH